MKVKDPVESCGGVTKEHEYLGHFAKSEHLSRGHNSNSLLEAKNPVVTKRFEFDDPNLTVGQGPRAEGKARIEKREAEEKTLDSQRKRTRMIEGAEPSSDYMKRY